MCKCKKIILMFMACVILVNSVFAQAIVVYADSETLNGIYELDLISPLNTQYNDENCVTQVSVTEKNVTGNTKHYLTWKNADGYDNDKVKVEIYAQIYLNVIDSEDMKIENDELENMKWNELALPVVRCCQVSANVKKACVNFTDLWNTLESVPDADLSKYNNWEAVSAVVDTIADLTVIFSNADTLGITQNTTARARYALSNGKTANYIKYSRVKYYVRYVYDSNIVSTADSMSLGIFENGKRIVHKAECYWKGDDREQKIRLERGDLIQTLGENERGCIVPLFNENGKTDYVFFSTSQGRSGQKLIGIEGTINEDYYIYDVSHCLMILSTLDAAFDYIENGNIDETKIMNNHSKYYKCGKVVENDTTFNDDNIAYDTDPGHNTVSSAPPVITDPGDTGDEDTNTDIVYWLKKIYRRLGAILTALIVRDAIDIVNSLVNGLVSDLTDTMESVTDNAESRFPFSVMYLVPAVLKIFVAEPVKPDLKYDFVMAANKEFGTKEVKYTLDLSKAFDYIDEYLKIVRNVEIALFVVYLAYYTFDVITFVRNGGITGD